RKDLCWSEEDAFRQLTGPQLYDLILSLGGTAHTVPWAGGTAIAVEFPGGASLAFVNSACYPGGRPVPGDFPVQLSVVGGVNVPVVDGNGKTLTSVDTLNRDNPVLPQSVPSGNSAGVVGGTITFSPEEIQRITNLPVAFETGFLARTEGNQLQ